MSDKLSSLDLCIGCISNDLIDINNSLKEISRQCDGAYTSWKFPTMRADSVDVLEYMRDPAEDKINHYVLLLELTVDRFVFLLNLLSERLGSLINGQGKSSLAQFTSVGLSIKKYWGLLTFLDNFFQHIDSQRQTYARKISQLEEKIKDFNIAPETGSTVPKKTNRSDFLEKCLQTDYETENLYPQRNEMIFNLKKISEPILKFCRKNRISSLVGDIFDQISGDPTEMAEITASLVSALQEDISKILSLNLELEIKNNNYNKIMEKKEIELNQEKSNFDHKINNLQDEISLMANLNKTIKDEREKIEIHIKEIEKENEHFKSSNNDKEREINKLTQNISQLHTTLALQKQQNDQQTAKITTLLENCSTRETEVNHLINELEKVKNSLQQETKDKNLLENRLSTFNAKQTRLLDRIEEISSKCRAFETEKSEFEQKLRHFQKESEIKDELLRNMTTEKINAEVSRKSEEGDVLRRRAEVEELRERVRLLVHFPDLNGPLPLNSGCVLEDMRSQIEANEVRMELLQQQTDKMRNTVRKIETVRKK